MQPFCYLCFLCADRLLQYVHAVWFSLYKRFHCPTIFHWKHCLMLLIYHIWYEELNLLGANLCKIFFHNLCLSFASTLWLVCFAAMIFLFWLVHASQKLYITLVLYMLLLYICYILTFCRRGMRCPVLFEFLCSSGIKFASVDRRGDRRAMERSWSIEIPFQFHVELQDLFRHKNRFRTGMRTMSTILIDDSYIYMKTKFDEKQHKLWEKQPLDDVNIHYAAVDGFVSYELYRKINDVMNAQVHLKPKEPKPPKPVPHYCPRCVQEIEEAKERRRKRAAWEGPDAGWKDNSWQEGSSNTWGWHSSGGWKPDESSDPQFALDKKWWAAPCPPY